MVEREEEEMERRRGSRMVCGKERILIEMARQGSGRGQSPFCAWEYVPDGAYVRWYLTWYVEGGK
jgi:hypothetical protein